MEASLAAKSAEIGQSGAQAERLAPLEALTRPLFYSHANAVIVCAIALCGVISGEFGGCRIGSYGSINGGGGGPKQVHACRTVINGHVISRYGRQTRLA